MTSTARVVCSILSLVVVMVFGTAATLDAQSPESLAMIEKLRTLRLDELGNPYIKSDAIRPVLSTADAPHRMLIIPVEYANIGFDRFAGEPDADERNRAYLQNLLFAEDVAAPGPGTLSHYYFHQSRGRYYVTGEVLPIVRVDKPSDYYGRPIQNSDGQWRNDVRAEELVADALAAAYARNPDFPWAQFDVWDPQDYDGDGMLAEPDGYIDHFVLVFAGRGQASCQRLFNLNEKFTVNAPADLYDSLSAPEQECAQRIWPHRFSLTVNNGKGPEVEGFVNRRGGVAVSDDLWVYDYNMQSEYTDISTFIHEFGHSLGLPDIYARDTNNSTASWEAMSSTVSPEPQELSAWSRLVLGWLDPCPILPRMAAGGQVQSVYLKTMNDWAGVAGEANPAGLCDAAMVILPPKVRELRLGPLDAGHGQQAAYTGQGNDMNHHLTRTFDLRNVGEGPVTLEFDTWFSIEADWDYLYVEASTDGETWQRLMPTDKSAPDDSESIMPSQRGHDGLGTIPGFTGRSGDLDGDGRVETNAGCDPTAERQLAEDRVGDEATDPCEVSRWVHAVFDLDAYRGSTVDIRFHYFADMAAVEDGALIDNVAVDAVDFHDDFEAETFQGWKVDGFSLSTGSHDIPVPHFYLLEYRDPYASFASAYNYDSNLAEPGFLFHPDDEGEMTAIDIRYRSGVLLWYYNGEYPWSENDPAHHGPGNGFLLLVDSTPQEFAYPGVPARYFRDDDGWRRYEFDADAQSWLRQAYLDVMCFQRRADYYPVDLSDEDRATCDEAGTPPGENVSWSDRQLLFGYTLINELLPGAAREVRKSMSTLFDIRVANDGIVFRLNDRSLRNGHSADAPFSLEPFADGLAYYGIDDARALVRTGGVEFSPVPSFSDADPSRYLSPHLPFGSASIPSEGLSFQLAEPGDLAPEGARVKVYFTWDR